LNIVFKCKMCGHCCKKSPVSLLPHEDILLRRLAEFFNLEYRSTPGYKFYDALSRSYIAVSYVMELVDNKCVFLRDNKCLIHDIYKPFICRCFPYVPRSVKYNIVWSSKVIYHTVEYGISSECTFMKEYGSFLRNILEHDSSYIYRFLGREINVAREMEEKRLILLNMLSNAWRNGRVELAEGSCSTNRVVNLYEFLRTIYPDLPYFLGFNRLAIEV